MVCSRWGRCNPTICRRRRTTAGALCEEKEEVGSMVESPRCRLSSPESVVTPGGSESAKQKAMRMGEEEGGKPIGLFGEKPGGYSRKGVDAVEGVEGVGVEEGEDGGVVLLPQEDSIEG